MKNSETRDDVTIRLEHGEKIIFGANKDRCVARNALGELEGRVGKKAMGLITEASMSPEKLKDLLLFLDSFVITSSVLFQKPVCLFGFRS